MSALVASSGVGAAEAAAASASPAAPPKQLNEAAQLIARELDYDEQRDATLDQLNSTDNGHYQMERNRLQLRRTVQLPQAILDQYDSLECTSYMGLFPEISRAWLTLDNRLFLWNYSDGSDFVLYDELSQVILSVCLLRPKPGVFVASIPYVLVLSTAVEVLMFAIKFEGDSVQRPLQLFPTQFTLPSDNVQLTHIVGTEQGRVLLASRDGAVYELDYWSGEDGGGHGGWLGAGLLGARLPFGSLFSSSRKKCRKLLHASARGSGAGVRMLRSILPAFLAGPGEATLQSVAYDSSRHFLWCLSVEPVSSSAFSSTSSSPSSSSSASTLPGQVKGSPVITLYDLGPDGWGMRERARARDLLPSVRGALRPLSPDLWSDLSGREAELHLASLCPVPASETEREGVVLMALTSHGHRLYFDLYRGDTLRLKFVRLCPPAIAAEEGRAGSVGLSGLGFSHSQPRAARSEPRFVPGSSPSLVRAALYGDGELLLVDSGRSSQRDSLISVHREPRPLGSGAAGSSGGYGYSAPLLNEAVESIEFDALVTDLGEVPRSVALNLLSSALYARSSLQSASAASSVRRGVQQPLVGLSELATQHLTPNRQFLVLTASALHMLSMSRPLDDLRSVLGTRRRSSDEAALLALAQKYGVKETCAMCLILACSAPGDDALLGGSSSGGEVERKLAPGAVQLASPNKMLLGLAGGAGPIAASMPVPGAAAHSPSSLGSSAAVSEEALRKAARQAFLRVGEGFDPRAVAPGAPSPAASRIAGLALFMSRWLRAHWDWSVCVSAPSGAGLPTGALQFRFSREFYLALLQPLTRLQRFIEEVGAARLLREGSVASAAPFGASSFGMGASAGVGVGGLADPSRRESEDLSALSALLGLSLEVFHLLLLCLSASDPAALLHSSPLLTPSDLQSLRDMPLSHLLINAEGHALVRKIIHSLAAVRAGAAAGAGVGPAAMGSAVPMLTDDSQSSPSRGLKRSRARFGAEHEDASDGSGLASGNALIAQLHQVCPSFFGTPDLLFFHAIESLSRARAAWNLPSERLGHIQSALRVFASFLSAPSYPLEQVADKLKGVHEYAGIVELAMKRAEMIERRQVPRPRAAGTMVGAGASAGAGAGMMIPSHGAAAEDDIWYREEKTRCVRVILDVINMLMFGAMAGKTLAQGSAANGSATPSRGVDAGRSGAGGAADMAASGSGIPPPSSEQLAVLRERVVSQILSSPDETLHCALYAWLIEKGLLDALYALQAPSLLRFLTGSEQHVLLLKDYYLRNEKWHEAALLLNYLSLTNTHDYTLSNRLDFLTRALQCARNAQAAREKHGVVSPLAARSAAAKRLTGGGVSGAASALLAAGADQQDLIDQIKDRIEIAKIQSEIYRQLQIMLNDSYSDSELARIESRASSTSRSVDVSSFQSTRDSLSSALLELDSSLLDLQSLYLLCTRFGLWECCLSIFAFSNESARSDVIAALWKNIFRAIMARCKRAGIDWADAVRDKFVELASDPATRYKELDFMFPLAFLARELEINNFRYRAHPRDDYVASTLLAADIPPQRLLAVYDQLLDSWEEQAMGDAAASGVNAQGQHIHTFLYWSVWHILRRIIEQERPSGARRLASSSSSAAASALSVFNKCLTNLRTLPPSTDTARLADAFQHLYEQFLAATR